MIGTQKAARGGYSASTNAWPFSSRSLLSRGFQAQPTPELTNTFNRVSIIKGKIRKKKRQKGRCLD